MFRFQPNGNVDTYREFVSLADRKFVAIAFEQTNNILTQAAKRLGMVLDRTPPNPGFSMPTTCREKISDSGGSEIGPASCGWT